MTSSAISATTPTEVVEEVYTVANDIRKNEGDNDLNIIMRGYYNTRQDPLLWRYYFEPGEFHPSNYGLYYLSSFQFSEDTYRWTLGWSRTIEITQGSISTSEWLGILSLLSSLGTISGSNPYFTAATIVLGACSVIIALVEEDEDPNIPAYLDTPRNIVDRS